MKTPIPVLVLFGPTASGKTGILFELSREIDIEVISADSMQVYRGMNIGTAKPSADEMALLPHHLIDIRGPQEQFNTGDFVRLAGDACHQVASRGKLPVVSGGTGFYLKNFILGLSEAPPSNKDVREQLKIELTQKGAVSLMDELEKCDPVSAGRIHIYDEYRLLRALEVYRSCGQPLSSFNINSRQKKESDNEAEFNFSVFGLLRPREELYNRINLRCEKMFEQGLALEVQSLYEKGYTPNDPGLHAIGYREFFIEDIENPGSWKMSHDTSGVKALIAQNSRRYAKRQITFFKGILDVNWIECTNNEAQTAKKIKEGCYAQKTRIS